MSPRRRQRSTRDVRSFLIQGFVLLGVIGFLWVIASNAYTNLERQGIASGFRFLGTTAGFDMSMSLIPYAETSTYGDAFIAAILNTLLVSVLGILAATFLGFGIGIARLSNNWLVARIAATYIEVVRNIPLLLQLFFWYFTVLRTLPSPRNSLSVGESVFLNIRGLYLPKPVWGESTVVFVTAIVIGLIATIALHKAAKRKRIKTGTGFAGVRLGLLLTLILGSATWFGLGQPFTLSIPELSGFNFQGGLVLIPELVALWVALATYTAAFIAEIVRAGILSVAKGQWEASLALGLTRAQTLRLVVIPQALRVVIPPLTSQFLNLTKNSSLAAAIAYPDLVLVFAGTVLMQTGQAIEVIALTMAVYLTISLSISIGMNIFNKRMALVER